MTAPVTHLQARRPGKAELQGLRVLRVQLQAMRPGKAELRGRVDRPPPQRPPDIEALLGGRRKDD
jgi:hypothetical protein